MDIKQMGVQKGKVKPEDLKKKLSNIVSKIGIPIQVGCFCLFCLKIVIRD